MLSKIIPIALLLLVLSQSQMISLDDLSTLERQPQVDDMAWPKKCLPFHNIYAVDRSGSMSKSGSWTRAMNFLGSQHFPLGTHRSLFSFWRGWGSSPEHVENYYTHDLNADLSSTNSFMSSPNGWANFDDALYRAIQILGVNYSQHTCLYIISDGWQDYSSAAVTNWKNAVLYFSKRTGCRFCVKCYFTLRFWWGTPQRMQQLCEELNATIYQLDGVKDIDFFSTEKILRSGPPTDPHDQDPVFPVKPDGAPSTN